MKFIRSLGKEQKEFYCQQFIKRSPSRLSHEITAGNKCRECPLKYLSVAKKNQKIHENKKKTSKSELQMWV